jgi:hypothetical protein
MKRFGLLLLVVLSLMLSGCYWQQSIDPSQVGVKLDDGISISGIVGPGRYSAGGWYSSMREVDISVKTTEWEDPDLVTSDKQPIGLKLALSYHRNPSDACVKQMYETYNSELFDNARLDTLVKSRVPNSAKDNTAKMTLDQMLFGREAFALALTQSVDIEMAKICVILDTVQVANIGADPGYMEKLKQKAQVIQDREIAVESVKTAEENLKKTKAETEIQLELARRQNAMNQELAKTYELNENYFKLEQLKLIREIVAAGGGSTKWVFVPEDSNLSFIDSGGTDIVPVPPTTTTAP